MTIATRARASVGVLRTLVQGVSLASLAWLFATLAGAGVAHAADEEPRPEDAVLTERVIAELRRGHFVDRHDIRVETEDAVVTLRGNVNTSVEREEAAERARNVDGVRRVENELLIGEDETDLAPAAPGNSIGGSTIETPGVP